MATTVRYYSGGYQSAAPQQNRAELWDGASATYTAWDTTGSVTASRPLTAAEVAQFAMIDTAASTQAGDSALATKLLNAIAGNGNDVAQDATIQAGAATIQGTAGPFTLAQATMFIKQLAQAVATLAGNDSNTKRQLTAVERKILGQTADTSGT